jgi:hypothetical protein
LPRAAARLACVKHSASVQSEPGSNSSVQFLFARLTPDFSSIVFPYSKLASSPDHSGNVYFFEMGTTYVLSIPHHDISTNFIYLSADNIRTLRSKYLNT